MPNIFTKFQYFLRCTDNSKEVFFVHRSYRSVILFLIVKWQLKNFWHFLFQGNMAETYFFRKHNQRRLGRVAGDFPSMGFFRKREPGIGAEGRNFSAKNKFRMIERVNSFTIKNCFTFWFVAIAGYF